MWAGGGVLIKAPTGRTDARKWRCRYVFAVQLASRNLGSSRERAKSIAECLRTHANIKKSDA